MSRSTENQAARSIRSARLILALLVFAGSAVLSPLMAKEAGSLPAPVLDEAPAQATSEVVVLAGGCFWGVQGVFQHVNGVTSAISGYAGGDKATAQYARVSAGTTGHAEAVQITFDPRVISLGKLLQVYFSVAHDPTELDRQGPDIGTQYRSAIFPTNAEQSRVAAAYIAQLNQARAFDAALATRIEPDRSFYPAEGYHQDFLTRNPNHAYIVFNDLPKIESLKHRFPALYRAEPVLVVKAGSLN
jgi:peptide-methionine (S)-S-oxide reductase